MENGEWISRVKTVKKAGVIKLLTLLNYRYSLRDLQTMLGIPYQTLWKYVTLVNMPEEKTSAKIVDRIEELNLLEKFVRETVEEARNDPYDIVRKPGFLTLFTMMVKNVLYDVKVGVIVPMSEYALMLATALSLELRCDVCPALANHPLKRCKGFFTTCFTDNEKHVSVAVPKHCLKNKNRALLVDVVLQDTDKVEAFLGLLRSARVEVSGVAAVISGKNVEEFVKGMGFKFITLLSG